MHLIDIFYQIEFICVREIARAISGTDLFNYSFFFGFPTVMMPDCSFIFTFPKHSVSLSLGFMLAKGGGLRTELIVRHRRRYIVV